MRKIVICKYCIFGLLTLSFLSSCRERAKSLDNGTQGESQTSDYVDVAVNSFDLHSKFVALDISFQGFRYRIVIKNNALFHVMDIESRQSYSKLVGSLIRIHKEYVVKNEMEFEKLKAHIVKPLDNCFARNNSSEMANFIRLHFTENRVLKTEYDGNMLEISDCLFQNGILTYTDDETGAMIYSIYP